MKRQDLANYLDNLMHVSDFEDYCPNGLQVEGREEIRKIGVAVSVSEEVILKCIDIGADALLVHHGHFWKNISPVITGAARRRIVMLLEKNINLFAYHLPLDFLPEYGNNEPALKALGVKNPLPFQAIGYTGELSESISSTALCERLQNYYQNPGTIVVPEKKNDIKKITLVSGGGQPYFQKAIEIGSCAYITGEGTEWAYNMARENNTVFAAMGHYATETVGPKLLARHLHRKFQIEWEFLVEDNPF